jgi:hypothetical protein
METAFNVAYEHNFYISTWDGESEASQQSLHTLKFSSGLQTTQQTATFILYTTRSLGKRGMTILK